MGGGDPWTPPPDGYDTAQVCLTGHLITATAHAQPVLRKPFCPMCGARTIMECQECRAPIQGAVRLHGSRRVSKEVPNNCFHCGTAFPWRQQALAAAVDAAQEALDEQDAAQAAELIALASVEGPRTELAAYRLKRLLDKAGKPVYDTAVKAISDVAAETAKKVLFG